LKKSGESFWIVVNLRHITSDGKLKYYLSNWVDITERKKIEESLKEEVDLRARFIDVLAHELRTPLSPILTSSSILNEQIASTADVRLKQLAANINNSTQILSNRLEELLDLARYSRGAFTLNTQPTDMSQFIAGVVARYQPFIENSEHRFILNVPARLPVVEIDPSRLEQVIINLLSNAVKYSPVDTRIELAVREIGPSLQIEVRDEGDGLSADEISKIFQPYYRRARDRQKSGLGLGLTICQQIVEAHGGKIQVESAPGQGSTFRITLPLK
jgi:signal transduction histidine kinase